MASYNAEEYRRSSHEKFRAASNAAQEGHYVVSHYLSGLAVECMLRAFRWRIDASWDAKHDIRALLKKCGVLGRASAEQGGRIQVAFNDLARRWTVSHRYAPSSRLEKFLRDAEIETGVREKRLQRNADTMLQCAQTILEECENVYNR